MQSQFSPTGAALYPVPGQSPLYQTTDVGTRAIWSENGRCFAVVGGGLWELFADGTKIRRNGAFGDLAQDAFPATISYNNNVQTLGITSGSNWYNYDLTTNILTQVAALNGKATQGGSLGGYYLCFSLVTGSVYVSNLNDGTTWVTGLSFFRRGIASDPPMAMLVIDRVYLIGEQTSEAWFNEGSNSNQPFALIQSSWMNYGTPATFSVGRSGDTIIWLTRTKGGSDQVVATRGYDPTPLSNYAVSTALSQIRKNATLSDAEIFIYEEDGHDFAGLQFWQAKSSWFVDEGSGEWHERGTWVPNQNNYDAWHPRIHGFAFGKHLTGDRSTGVICESSISYATDADGVTGMRRLRIGPPIWAAANKRVQVSRLQFQFDVGLGLLAGQGSDPQAMLRESIDGRTWGSQRMCSAGPMGQYRRKVFFTRCTSSENLWVPELTVSDPIPWRVSGAQILASGVGQLGRAA